MITIYGSLGSPFVARCVMAMRLKQLEHEILPPPGGLKSPEYMKISPFGKVPTLVDGDFATPESEVICEYLDEAYPNVPLLPKNPVARAKSRMVSRICDLYLFPGLFALSRMANPSERNEGAITEKLAEVGTTLDILEKAIVAEPYACGSEWTMADCALIPTYYHIRRVVPHFKIDPFRRRPHMTAYNGFIDGNEEASQMLKEMDTAWNDMMKRSAA